MGPGHLVPSEGKQASPLARVQAQSDSQERRAVDGVWSGPAVLGQRDGLYSHTAVWLLGGCLGDSF